MIFYLLRSIPSGFLIRDCSPELRLNTVEIIVKWLQVSVSECIRQATLRLKTQFVSRDLVPSDRATCTIASRVNFFDKKLNLNFEVCYRGKREFLEAERFPRPLHTVIHSSSQALLFMRWWALLVLDGSRFGAGLASRAVPRHVSRWGRDLSCAAGVFCRTT